MNRRGFFGMIGAVIASLSLPVPKLDWASMDRSLFIGTCWPNEDGVDRDFRVEGGFAFYENGIGFWGGV